jgi:hypothetical protein
MHVAARAFVFDSRQIAILPMIETEYELKGFFRALRANVFGVYGGPISTSELTSAHFEGIARHLHRANVKRIDLIGNPHAPAITFDGWTVQPNFTQVFSLDRFSSAADVSSAYTHLIRNHINRAERAGYSVTPASNAADVSAYEEIYRAALERRGESATGRQDPAFFGNLLTAGRGNAVLWLVRKENRAVGGVIVLYHNRVAIAWHASFLAEDFKFGVAKFLHHRIIVDAKERGLSMYDFNPSGGHEGTVRFKELFGAQRVDFAGARWENNLYRAYRQVRTLLPAAT